MKRLFALFLIFICSAALAEEPRPEVGRYVKAYSGDEGIQVFVIRLGPAEKGDVLLMFSHVDHPQDGVIQKAKVESNERARRYIIQKDGKDYVPLIIEGTGGIAYLSALPNNPRNWRVQYDDGLAARANPEHLLTQWMESGKK